VIVQLRGLLGAPSNNVVPSFLMHHQTVPNIMEEVAVAVEVAAVEVAEAVVRHMEEVSQCQSPNPKLLS
jgi:hypothetical protein